MGRVRSALVMLAVVTAVFAGAAPAGAKAKKPKKPVSTCKLLTVAEITTAGALKLYAEKRFPCSICGRIGMIHDGPQPWLMFS